MSSVRKEIHKHVYDVRAVDTHSHMRSVNALDIFTEARAVLEPGAKIESYGIFDLLCGAYMYWGLPEQPEKAKVYAESKKDPIGAFREIRPLLEKWQSTGHWQAIHIALKDLYGFSELTITEDNVGDLDNRIRQTYEAGYYARATEALKLAGVERSLKMVQIPWLTKVIAGEGEDDEAKIERELICPICSIDVGISGPTTTRDVYKERTLETLGMTLKTPDDHRRMIEEMFALMDRTKVYGLKNATAYGRDLNFAPTTDAEFDQWVDDFTKDPKKAWEDTERRVISTNYLMRRVLAEANQRNLPIQMHAGTTNITSCDPRTLMESKCLGDFAEVKFVLLHVYPFAAEHAVLLRATNNLYSDLSWLALCSGDLLEDALVHLIGFAADYRVVIGLDAPSLEEAYGAMVMTRRALENALVRKVESGYLNLSDAVEIPYRLLRNNAISIWQLPLEEQEPQ